MRIAHVTFALVVVSAGCGARSELELPHTIADASVVEADAVDANDTTLDRQEDVAVVDVWEPDPRCPQIGSGPDPGSPCADEGLMCRYVDDCDLVLFATCTSGSWTVDRRPCG